MTHWAYRCGSSVRVAGLRVARAARSLGRDLAALFPRACAGCGGLPEAPEAVLCGDCHRSVAWIDPQACLHCQEHPASAEGRCPGRRGGDPLDACVAAAWWEPPVSDWIAAFKYPSSGWQGLDPAPGAAARWLVATTRARAPHAPDWIVPVPLHPRRVRERGFQPAGLLARHVAHRAGTAFTPDALARVRDTPSQTGMSAAERRTNLRGAIVPRRALSGIVWIVDDVVTTGTTLRETARVARTAGAERVIALCAARTPSGRARERDG